MLARLKVSPMSWSFALIYIRKGFRKFPSSKGMSYKMATMRQVRKEILRNGNLHLPSSWLSLFPSLPILTASCPALMFLALGDIVISDFECHL
jgi:hypothetical protein